MCAKYDKQIRELRTQINMKGKDLQNQRDEISDLETRLQQKLNELKSVRSQIAVL
jgi:predicted  nucleic acid-binding Zn-ribbon protein